MFFSLPLVVYLTDAADHALSNSVVVTDSLNYVRGQRWVKIVAYFWVDKRI